MKFSIVKKWRCSSFIFQNTFAQEPAKGEFRDIHFEIPALCRRHYSWSISLCIVSEYSADGRELLHGEKGGKERETLYGPQVSTVIRLFLIAVIFKKEKGKRKKRAPRSSCSPEKNIKGSRESRNDSRIQYPLEKIRKIFIRLRVPTWERKRTTFFIFYCQQRSLLRDSGSSCFIPSLLNSLFLSFFRSMRRSIS